MAWKLKYRCTSCGYEAEVYEGQGLFRQQISPMSCPDCKTIQNIVVGGIIGDVAPSFRSEAGRLCLKQTKKNSGRNYFYLRHTLTIFPYSVANRSPCRNNFDKN